MGSRVRWALAAWLLCAAVLEAADAESPLLKAAKTGDINRIRALIEQRADVFGVGRRPSRILEELEGEDGALPRVRETDEERKERPGHTPIDSRFAPEHVEGALVLGLLDEDGTILRLDAPRTGARVPARVERPRRERDPAEGRVRELEIRAH